jgi:hypothetical protein
MSEARRRALAPACCALLLACSPVGLEAEADPAAAPGGGPRELRESALEAAGATAAGATAALSLRSQLELSLTRAPDRLEWVERADGLKQVEQVRGFRHATVLLRRPDGATTSHCIRHAREAVALLDEARR